MRDLAVLVPSRGRPHNIERLISRMRDTCRGDTILIIGLDNDDPALGEYPVPEKRSTVPITGFGGRRAESLSPPGPVYEVKPGLRLVVPWMNALAAPRADQYRFLGTLGDDNIPNTPGWDVQIMEALEKTPFAYGNDLYPRPEFPHPASLCCHVFMRSEVVRRLGYFGPPGIRHMYVDVAWMAWGRKCGITYLHDVNLQHFHYTTGAPIDDSYRTSSGEIPADLERWHHYCNSGQLNEDIAKIDPGASPFTPEEMRGFNIGLNIPPHWGQWGW